MPWPFSMRSSTASTAAPCRARPLERHAQPVARPILRPHRVGAGASQRLGGRVMRRGLNCGGALLEKGAHALLEVRRCARPRAAGRARDRAAASQRVRFGGVERALDQAQRVGRLRREMRGQTLPPRASARVVRHAAPDQAPLLRAARRSPARRAWPCARARADPTRRGSKPSCRPHRARGRSG